MKGVYESNTFLGDPQTIQGELKECEHKLEKLKNEMRKYQILLEDAKSQQSHSPQTRRSSQQNGENHLRKSRYLHSYNLQVFFLSFFRGFVIASFGIISFIKAFFVFHFIASFHRVVLYRHSNGSNEDGDDQVDDTRSLSRSASENNIEKENTNNDAHNGGGLPNINNNSNNIDSNENNGYKIFSSFKYFYFPLYY